MGFLGTIAVALKEPRADTEFRQGFRTGASMQLLIKGVAGLDIELF